MKLTQNDRLLAALRKGKAITMLDGYRICGSLNTHRRIEELSRVWSIAPIWVKRGGRKHRAWKLIRRQAA